MIKQSRFLLSAVFLACSAGSASAQVLEYIDCEVHDPASFVAASEQFLNTMSGGYRPTVSIDQNLWNGSSSATHTVTIAYESHRDVETFGNRVEQNPAAFMQLVNSLNAVASCENEGLAVRRGVWGDLEAPWEYYAVYPVTTTDGARYSEALADYLDAIIDTAPGPIAYYENRAGEEGVTHFVVFFSPSLATLNEFLDELTSSDAYTDFVDEVRSIRTLHTATQSRRLVSWDF